ncbi:putative Two-component sensor histidine kinase [Magnetospirillum sp. XM-1]|uniref:ATP-binding protein n=1 Tax=Magnetospirillum sp. XM-1 TaxID=1663591 RepID=UPI00073DEDE2|nr:ATP-binding protein [Magnetospirillum sp. XM-1]CUW39610.1 putative Two-component sensor histidine kinase [Magnetospirillum sp. XM-1]
MRRFAMGGKLFPLVFLAVYVVVDWGTFIHDPPAINITPWNPPAGLYVALLLLERRGYGAALTFAALMLGDLLVRGSPAPIPVLALSNLLIVAAYGAGVWLLSGRLAFDATLGRMYDTVWLVIMVPVAAVAAALGFALPYMAAGLLPWSELPAVTAQYWVGDVIAILTVTPFLLLLRRRTPGNGPRRSRFETASHALAVACALAVTFNPLVPDPSKILYVLFLPVIWVAMRRGLAGTTVAVLGVQMGVIAGLSVLPGHWQDLTYYQTVMVALAATGLLVGAVVSERWRLEASLGQRRAELARVARLSLIGEMASSLAHELNQPLFTTMGYTRASRQLLARGGDQAEVLDLMNRAVAEAERAAEVLRSIRGFLRQDGQPAQVELKAALDGILGFVMPEIRRHGITLTVDLPPDLQPVWIDPVQLDQVLLNLLRNSIDALANRERPDGSGRIAIAATRRERTVEVSVADTGPGVPEDKVGPLFDLFFTTKPSGMGLGLPICRSIVESHGGRLWLARNGPDGACFSFTLPLVSHA